MNKIIGLLVMAFMFLPWRPIVAIVAAVLFVNINGTELYGWQAGLAHGLFFLPNLVRHLFDGVSFSRLPIVLQVIMLPGG